MSEWPKEHAWKVCIPQGIEGSTPSLTAIFKEVNCTVTRITAFGLLFVQVDRNLYFIDL